MSSILIGASILILMVAFGAAYMADEPGHEEEYANIKAMVEFVGPPTPPISAGISTLVSVGIPAAGYEFEEEWQKPWRTTYDMLIAKGIDHMNVGYYDHKNDEFCVIHVTYLDGREFCWDGQSESFSVR